MVMSITGNSACYAAVTETYGHGDISGSQGPARTNHSVGNTGNIYIWKRIRNMVLFLLLYKHNPVVIPMWKGRMFYQHLTQLVTKPWCCNKVCKLLVCYWYTKNFTTRHSPSHYPYGDSKYDIISQGCDTWLWDPSCCDTAHGKMCKGGNDYQHLSTE